jgi:hypothetical protein
MTLCIFQTVFPSIIRSWRLHTATGICQTGTAVCLLASRLHYLFDIYLLLYVQSWTPDDGWKDHLKHVECYSKIKYIWEIVTPSWIYYRKKVCVLVDWVVLELFCVTVYFITLFRAHSKWYWCHCHCHRHCHCHHTGLCIDHVLISDYIWHSGGL